MCRVCHGTQILADQLTLFQPGGTDYAHLVITTGTPGFSDFSTALILLVTSKRKTQKTRSRKIEMQFCEKPLKDYIWMKLWES